jgi:hypothetical protein
VAGIGSAGASPVGDGGDEPDGAAERPDSASADAAKSDATIESGAPEPTCRKLGEDCGSELRYTCCGADDKLRRGRPTVHVVYGDGLAILAGDGLLTEAFGVLATSPSPVSPIGSPEAPADRRLRVMSVLGREPVRTPPR